MVFYSPALDILTVAAIDSGGDFIRFRFFGQDSDTLREALFYYGDLLDIDWILIGEL